MLVYKNTVAKLIEQEIAAGQINGASMLVLHKGKKVYFDAFGYADKEAAKPMKRDTIIRLFSMSKPITAVAVMILAERGELDLRDNVSKYLPYFKNQTVWDEEKGEAVPVCRDATIWDMLNMTSGLPYPGEDSEPERRMDAVFKELIQRRENGERVDTQEYLRRIAQVPLCFQPGEKWHYGLSADVLGGVVEAISGKTYGEFLREEIFLPLDMKDTGFFVPEEKKDRFAQNYIWDEKVKALVPFITSQLGEYYNEDVAFESGGAGLVSTLDDYSHFAQMLLSKGEYQGKRILGSKTVEFMTKNRLSEAQKIDFNWDSLWGYGYGCLMRVLTDQGAACSNASLGEYGWDGWTGNYVTIDPEEELVLIYFMQKCNTGTTPLVRKLRMATYGALDEL